MRKIILSIIVFTCLGKNNANAQYWSTLGEGMATTSSDGVTWVNALAMYNGELYAGGVFDSAGGIAVNRIAKWNGTKLVNRWHWCNWSGVTDAMIVYQGELFVGRYFNNAGGIAAKNIAKWKWNRLGSCWHWCK